MRRILILLLGLPALAGCGGGGGRPPLAPAVADRLARQADAVAASAAAGQLCTAARHATALQAATIRAINAHEIPLRYQEPLQARTTELVAELQPECLPTPAAAPTGPPPAARPAGPPPGRHEHGHGHGHGHGGGD